jgi:hypothetical protein
MPAAEAAEMTQTHVQGEAVVTAMLVARRPTAT